MALALLIITVALGVLNLVIVKNKNRTIEKKILELKVEENRIVLLINSERKNQSTQSE